MQTNNKPPYSQGVPFMGPQTDLSKQAKSTRNNSVKPAIVQTDDINDSGITQYEPTVIKKLKQFSLEFSIKRYEFCDMPEIGSNNTKSRKTYQFRGFDYKQGDYVATFLEPKSMDMNSTIRPMSLKEIKFLENNSIPTKLITIDGSGRSKSENSQQSLVGALVLMRIMSESPSDVDIDQLMTLP